MYNVDVYVEKSGRGIESWKNAAETGVVRQGDVLLIRGMNYLADPVGR